MEYRVLGKDGPQVPVLGFGAWPLGGGMGIVDESVAISTIHAAIDNGLTLIDTAQAYRTSETIIGRALKNGYRERCFLATKASFDYSRAGILTAMENSLRALQVDYVDLYQLHGWNPQYPIEESLETLARLQEAGKTRYIGVSNFNARQMQQALRVARFCSNQIIYNLFDRQIEAEDIPFCERAGIGILTHSSLAKGLLSGRYTPRHKFSADDERSEFPSFQGEVFARYLALADQLKQVAQAKGLSLIQLAIAWLLRLPAVTSVLVGAKNPAQVTEYGGAVGVVFTSEELSRIDEILLNIPQSTTGV
jgi:aryl-alcohol dehydrogenase-like predicted oxidoreductase